MGALFDRAAASYGADEADAGMAFFSHFGRRLVAIAGVTPGQAVLDLGAGRGAVLLPAAAAVGPSGSVTGIDLAPEMVRLTQQDIRRRGLGNAEMLHGDASEPRFATGSFDVILGGLVAFLLPDLQRALAHYHRLLRPRGRLGLSTFAETPADVDAMVSVARRFAPPLDLSVRRGRGPGPVVGVPVMTAALCSAGFDDVRSDVEEHQVTFRDRDHWWRWQWSHGGRGLLEQIPPVSTHAFRQAVDEQLEPLCGPDGALELRIAMRYTTARRAAP